MFSNVNEVTSPELVSVSLAKGTEQDKEVRAERVRGEETGMALCWPRDDTKETNRKLSLRRSSGACFGVVQMIQDFPNDFLFSYEGDDAEGASTLTFQGVG